MTHLSENIEYQDPSFKEEELIHNQYTGRSVWTIFSLELL